MSNGCDEEKIETILKYADILGESAKFETYLRELYINSLIKSPNTMNELSILLRIINVRYGNTSMRKVDKVLTGAKEGNKVLETMNSNPVIKDLRLFNLMIWPNSYGTPQF